MTLRVLALTAAYPSPAEPERAIFLENLHRALIDESRGAIEVSVLAPRVHAGDPRFEARRGIEVRRFACPSGGRRLKSYERPPPARLLGYLASGFWSTLAELRRRRAQLLLCHWVLPSGLMGRLAAVAARVPLVLVAHGSDVHRYALGCQSASALARWALSGASRVVAVSKDLARTLASRLGVPAERLRVCPMGVGEDFHRGDRDAARRDLGLDGELTLLAVGDLIVEKGLRDLAKALRKLQARGLGVTVRLAGSGPLAQELEGTPGVQLLGSLPPRVLASWYRAADVLVHPSHAEGSPLAVMEALSSGLPVVAARVGGVPDLVVEGRSGVLVPPRDPEALAAAVARLVETPGRLEAMRAFLAEAPPDFSVCGRARDLMGVLVEAADAGA